MNTDTQFLYKALGIYLEAMRKFAVDFLEKNDPNIPWELQYENSFDNQGRADWQKIVDKAKRDGGSTINKIDFSNLKYFAIHYKKLLIPVFGDVNKINNFIGNLYGLNEARNKCQHYDYMADDEIEHAFSCMKMTAIALKMTDLRDEIDKYLNQWKNPQTAAPTAEQQTTPAPAPTVAAASANALLPSWFNVVKPHYDILNGVLDESIFAANLNEVASATGPEVYTNASMFFEKTFVTAGLREIANRVVLALNGEQTENRVISLQTGFGGGKTHTLISLYHIAKSGNNILNFPSCEQMMNDGVKPNFNKSNVCVFTNNTTDIVQGREVEDGIKIYTLWGEIAYQLGGKSAYEKIRENDVKRTAPTSTIMKPILEQAAPALILIDELADYCSKATSHKVGSGTLFNQTTSFVQTLTEVVSQVPKCVLIATLPASAREIANSAVGQEVLATLETRIVRVGSSVKPVEDEEIFEVVRRRLFEPFTDYTSIDLVANKYKKMYENYGHNVPDEARTVAYAAKIKRSYPFHPELIDMFRLRWGEDHRFQRTRGVLRLLASIVQDLWKRRSSLTGTQALIQTSDVCFENLNTLSGTVTSLMGANWETVMHADVYGTSSNAYKKDNEDVASNLCKYRITQGLAATLLMASVGGGQRKGMDLKQLKLCVMKPASFNHNDVDGAMNNFGQVAHYLYSSNIGGIYYWFQSKPNINILINEAASDITTDDKNAEILRRLKSVNWGMSNWKVLVAPSTDVPEQQQLTLIVLSPQYAVSAGNIPSKVSRFIKDIALKRGNSDRVYRNTILYLTCSEAGLGVLHEKIQKYLACDKTLNDYGGQVEKEQKEEILSRKKNVEKELNGALVNAYNTVIKYSVKDDIETYELKEFATDFAVQISNNLTKEMKENEWVVDMIGRGQLSKHNLFPTIDTPIQVCKIGDAFLRFDDKPKLFSLDAVKNSVLKYCSDGLFNVAVIVDGVMKNVYHQQTIPYFDVKEETYWLVDPSVAMPAPTPTPTSTTNPTPAPPSTPGTPAAPTNPATPTSPTTPVTPTPPTTPSTPTATPTPTVRVINKVVISGEVPLEQWTQLFTSFVNPLKNNNLKIQVNFTASTTALNELTDISATYRSIKESASQLGMDFSEE